MIIILRMNKKIILFKSNSLMIKIIIKIINKIMLLITYKTYNKKFSNKKINKYKKNIFKNKIKFNKTFLMIFRKYHIVMKLNLMIYQKMINK